MHDKIADIQFVKTGYRLSVILFLLFTFFVPACKNIIFRNHDKLQKRILKALVQTAVSDHNRAFKHFIFKIFTEIRRQPRSARSCTILAARVLELHTRILLYPERLYFFKSSARYSKLLWYGLILRVSMRTYSATANFSGL